MSRSSVLILLGILAVLVPFSGLPSALRTILSVALGAAVLGIGVAMRSKEQRRSTPPTPASPELPVA